MPISPALPAGVQRLTDVTANAYLLESPGGPVLLDCLWPRSRAKLQRGLAEHGLSPADVTAVVLTHADPDHIGTARWLAESHGAELYIHPSERPRALGQREPVPIGPLLRNLWRPATASFVAGAVRRGVRDIEWPTRLSWEPLPAGLEPVPTPGHTEGHCAYLLREAGILFCGDALMTKNIITGAQGPRVHPVSLNYAKACESLVALGETAAVWLLPGHGAAWHGDAAEAIAQARSVS